MFAYYFQLGLRSLKRNPMLTGLMVMAIGFGVAASMITYSVFRAVSANPIPEKSSQLFAPQLDSWGPDNREDGGHLVGALDYVDAMAMMRAHVAKRQTFIYSVLMPALPHGSQDPPHNLTGYAVTGDFFPMFDVPFQYGSGWTQADDDAHTADVVISDGENQRLFGGQNSVGRSLTLGGHDYRIVGVTRHWDPQPRFYSAWADESVFDNHPDVFVPLQHALDLRVSNASRNSCRGNLHFDGWEQFLQSNCVWLMPWVELDTPAEVTNYRNYLTNYAADQQRAGRYGWAPAVELSDVTDWLVRNDVVPSESRISLVVAVAFFLICLINTIGLLLAKFMRRAGEIGVRRALGATRGEIYAQYLTEAASVGVAGGLVGLLLTAVGISGTGLLFEPDIARLAHLDMSLVGITLAASVVATVAAAFYPAWCAAQVQPAWHLKSN